MSDREASGSIRLVRAAVEDDDADEVRRLLAIHPELKARIDDCSGDFDSPLILYAKSTAMIDTLLDAGSDINVRSKWWAGGFGLLDIANPEVAMHAIQKGARIPVHAAARLSLFEELKRVVEADRESVRAQGGDGQTPLHFAATVQIAEYLLNHGADIDAPDVDHESAPAQYMLGERDEVARYLIRRGCKTDILMSAALGDTELVRKHLDADPEAIRTRVSDEYFPMVGAGKGGTIYQWKLGWYVSPLQVAKKFRRAEVVPLLTERSPDDEKLLNACWLHDNETVNSLLAQTPNLAEALTAAGRRHVAHAARNNDMEAARLMLTAGLPVDTYSQHHATALHWAAFHGNAELVRLILSHRPSLEDADNEFKSTPLGWAIYGSEHSWYRQPSDHATTVTELLNAGATRPAKAEGGSAAVREVLRGFQ